jgi:hypothetical protein
MWFHKPTNRTVRKLLSTAPGPAPWYWESFPSVELAHQRLVWRKNPADTGRSLSVLLQPEGRDDSVSLAVSMYSRVFRLPPNLLGIWFEENNRIRIFAIDPDSLKEFSLNAPLPVSVKDYGGFTCAGGVLGEASTSTDLEADEHRIDLPLAFAGLQSIIMIGNYARIREAACAALFEINPGTTPGSWRLGVMPQSWFTRGGFDLGYQWITRVARDPVTSRIVGDGIRISPFVLTENGCHIDRWIK